MLDARFSHLYFASLNRLQLRSLCHSWASCYFN